MLGKFPAPIKQYSISVGSVRADFFTRRLCVAAAVWKGLIYVDWSDECEGCVWLEPGQPIEVGRRELELPP